MPLIAPSISLVSLGLLDIVGADALEDLAEQIELRIGVGGACGGLGPGDQMFALRARHQKGQADAGQRAQEKEEILPHMPRCLLALWIE